MSAPAFTPGPWKIEASDDACFVDISTGPRDGPEWYGLARVPVRTECEHTGDSERDEEGEANARLIAAAPELYAFAEQSPCECDYDHSCRRCRALSRARGEPPQATVDEEGGR